MQTNFEEITSTQSLANQLNDEAVVVLDIRPLAAYRGWKLHNEKRGGHLPGAVDFPADWFDRMEAGQLRETLQSKGVVPDKRVIVYGYQDGGSENIAARLEKMGFATVAIFTPGHAAWAADDSLPLEGLPNYEKLVYPEWLQQLVTGGQPPEYAAKEYLIFEVGNDEEAEYAAGHIPTAIYFDPRQVETDETGNRLQPHELERALRANGITKDKTVVVYTRGSTAGARVAVILMYSGIADVRLLDGGIGTWRAAGFTLETQENLPSAVEDSGVTIPSQSQLIINIEGARERLQAQDAALVSVRSWPEYTGDTSGYKYIGPQGRIAGALWGHAGSDKDKLEQYRNFDNTMRNYHEIAANWREWDITPEKRVAFYCGTGWRASEAFFNAYLMGWPDIAVYDGGWYEWSSDPNNPVEHGTPE